MGFAESTETRHRTGDKHACEDVLAWRSRARIPGRRSIAFALIAAGLVALAACGYPQPARVGGDAGGGDVDSSVSDGDSGALLDAPPSCGGQVCDSAPPPVCIDAQTLRTYGSTGTCSMDACSYPHADATCAGGCDSGACLGACSGSVTFDFTAAPQAFTPPSCAHSITVDVYGAAGGVGDDTGASGSGGLGGRVQGVIAIAATDAITVVVGGVGGDAGNDISGKGGYNGGAEGVSDVFETGAGGGGASDIRRGGSSLADRIFVAGGGGGGTACGHKAYSGGDGGGLTGGDASGCDDDGIGTVSGGGTQTAGGAGGKFPEYKAGESGKLGAGGAGGSDSAAGGGGGGLYGGGGGSWNGGAGGSSFAASSATGVVHTQGVRAGDGRVIISY